MNTSKISNRCRYAIMAAVELAQVAPGELLTISQIAKNQKIPSRFLEAILRELKSAGILGSVRGNSGGYFLRMNANELRIGTIVETLEPQANLTNTALVSECERVIEELYAKAHKSFYSVLYSTTLTDVIRDMKLRESVISYVI